MLECVDLVNGSPDKWRRVEFLERFVAKLSILIRLEVGMERDVGDY